MDQTINSIAVVRLSAIGDVCHTMAVIGAVQRQYPNARITWITSPLEANVVRLLPNVEVRVYDKKSGVKGMLALRKALSKQRFDVLLHLQWSLRASLLSRMVRAVRRIGFHLSVSREKQHWFVNEYGAKPRGPHVLDSLLSVVERLGVSEPLLPLPLNLPDAPVSLKTGYVVLNPSASKAERNWTTEGYQAVIDRLVSKGHQVVLTGGVSQAEKALASQFEQDAVVNLVGKTSLPEMFTVLANAKLVISPDTGPAHMTTLVGTPVLGLYAHSNPLRTGPYKDLDKVVSVYEVLAEKEYGKPIKELPWASRVHDPDAMKAITIDQVIAQLEKLI